MKQKKQDSPFAVWVAMIGFIMIGGFVLYLNFVSLYQSIQSQKEWSQTKGKVIKSFVITKDAQTIRQTDRYIPYVQYIYKADNTKHINDKIHFYNPKVVDIEKAKQVIKKYPVNSIVAVYYNPQKPYESVLVMGTTEYADTFWEILFGAFFLILGLFLAYLKIKER
jgi:hypothetical protein